MRQVISILLENEAGALSRVVGLFSQRGYNIENITAAPTEDKSISRITILTEGDGTVVERITKQLHKLVNVIKVSSQQDNSCDICHICKLSCLRKRILSGRCIQYN